MNSKGHFCISLVKSLIRIGGGICAIIGHSVLPLAVCLVLAEVCGILEEVFDDR